MGTGNCIFDNEILSYIALTPIHHGRNERELPDLIQCAVDDGKEILSFDLCERYGNINTQDDIEIIAGFLNRVS